jgi:hypothetical protein
MTPINSLDDYKEYLRHIIWEEDSLALVIRGHLYVEQELNRLIGCRVLPEVLRVWNPSFTAKVKLAVTLDLMSSVLRNPTLILNDLRNKVAHDVDARLNEADANHLFESCEKEGLFIGAFPKMERGSTTVATLSRCIRAVLAFYHIKVLEAFGMLPKGTRFHLGPAVTSERPKDMPFDQELPIEDLFRIKESP